MGDSVLQQAGSTSISSILPQSNSLFVSAFPVIANLSLNLVELDNVAGLVTGEQFQVQAKFIDIRNTSVLQSVFGGYGDVHFDPKLVRVDSISYSNNFTVGRTGIIDNTLGIVDEVGAVLNGIVPITDTTIFTLNMTALAVETASVTTSVGENVGSEVTLFGIDGDQRTATNFGLLGLPTIGHVSADLTAVSFDAVSDHVLKGESVFNFKIENKGGAAGAFRVDFIHSDDEVIGNFDDVVVGSRSYSGLAANTQLSDTITLKLPIATLNNRAKVDDPTGKGSGYQSTSFDFVGMVIDAGNTVKEKDETNNSNRGKGIDKDDVTFFPWDVNGSNSVTASDAIFVINRLGQNTTNLSFDARADIDGNGLVTAADAISVINRLGYKRNESVIESVAPVLPTVAIAANDASAGEVVTGQTQNAGQFTLSRTGSTTAALTVGYTISGTATNGTDYSTLSGSVTFAVGAATAVVNVGVINDSVFEGSESVVLTLATNATYVLGATTRATVTIADNDLPTITVTANDANAGEVVAGQTQNSGQFTLSRSGSTSNALAVNFGLGGTATSGSDYSALATSVTFAAGASTAMVNVNVIDDLVFEGTEAIFLELIANAAYALDVVKNATVTIADNDLLISVTDFNKDGKTDIFWRKPQDGTNIVRPTNANDLIIESRLDSAWYPVALADFNNDGNVDILWRYHWKENSGANEIWLMNNDNQRISTVTLNRESSNDWEVVGTGDFNNDGNVDILWRNYKDLLTAVWLLNPLYQSNPVTISVPVQDNPGAEWRIKGTGDFNNDGKIDILWRNNINGEVAVWFMDGLNRTSVGVLAKKESSLIWDIVGTNDFNNDGKIDIQWRASNTGENAVWLMNGITYVDSLNLGIVLTDWMTVGYKQPDLIVQNLSVPSSINVGDSVTISSVVKNIGKAISVPSNVRYWLSNDIILDKNTDTLLGQNYISNWLSTGNLGTGVDGSSQYNSLTFTYNSAWGTGSKYIFFEADSDNYAFNETNEGNNIAYQAITITSLGYYSEINLSDSQWDVQSGDDNQFRSDSPYGGGDQRWKTDDRIEQIYTDLSNTIFGYRVDMNSGYAYDAGYYNGQIINGSTGWWHAGLDMDASNGATIKAAIGGSVAWIGKDLRDGYVFVGINSDDGRQWVYGHLKSSSGLWDGKRINAGDTVGLVGMLNHLHLEVENGHAYGYTDGAMKNQNTLLSVTVSPLMAYWQWRNR